jgi:hypothetical protein
MSTPERHQRLALLKKPIHGAQQQQQQQLKMALLAAGGKCTLLIL